MSNPGNFNFPERIWLLYIALVFVTLTGCVNPSNHIDAFFKASAQLSTEAKKGYELVKDTSFERKFYSTAADLTADLGKDDVYKQTFELAFEKALNIRITALEAIQEYASALSDLSSAEFRDDLDKSAKELNGALNGLNSTVTLIAGKKIISGQTLGIIATAVDAIGATIQEKKRREAIKEIVIQSDPSIQEIAAAIKEEYALFQPLIERNLSTIQTEMIKEYERKKGDWSLQKRVTYLKRIKDRTQSIARLPQYSKKLAEACEKLGEAHGILNKSVSSGEFSARAIVKQIGEMAQLAKSIKKFHKEVAADSSNP